MAQFGIRQNLIYFRKNCCEYPFSAGVLCDAFVSLQIVHTPAAPLTSPANSLKLNGNPVPL
jgi:hypothetical protein